MKKFRLNISCIAESPQPEEKKAEEELKKYLSDEKSKNIKEVIIDRSEKFTASPEAESYSIHATENELKITGDGASGILWGAYDFIEKCGAKYYFDQPEGLILPSAPEWKTGDWKESPDFELRSVGTSYWGTFNRTNGSPDLSCGGKSAAVIAGDSIAHSFYIFLNPANYFDAHPDWFPLINGKRQKFNPDFPQRDDILEKSYYNQICTSNENAVSEFAENIKRYLRQNPGTKFVPAGPNDGFGFCECKNCRQLDTAEEDYERQLSARLINFWNAVAREIKDEFPDVMLLGLAYINYTLPPSIKKIQCEPNVAIMIAHYQHCNLHSVARSDCPPNACFRNAIEEWQRVCNNIYIFEYYWKCNWWGGLWPVHANIPDDIAYFKSKGIKGVFTQYSQNNSLSLGLNYYLAAKLTWTSGADREKLISEWIEGVYGKAAGPMHEVYYMLEERFRNANEHFPGSARINMAKIYSGEFLAEVSEKVGAAEKHSSNPREKYCVNAFDTALKHSMRLRDYSKIAGSHIQRDDKLGRMFSNIENPVFENPQKFRGVLDISILFKKGFYLAGEKERICGKKTIDMGAIGQDSDN